MCIWCCNTSIASPDYSHDHHTAGAALLLLSSLDSLLFSSTLFHLVIFFVFIFFFPVGSSSIPSLFLSVGSNTITSRFHTILGVYLNYILECCLHSYLLFFWLLISLEMDQRSRYPSVWNVKCLNNSVAYRITVPSASRNTFLTCISCPVTGQSRKIWRFLRTCPLVEPSGVDQVLWTDDSHLATSDLC